MPTFEQTENLVKERITWFRKWTDDIPNYTHSLNVRDLLRSYWFDETVQMAWLLHDIIEDWDTTIQELAEMGYPQDVLTLVDLATHNKETEDKFQRRKDMMKRLEEANNKSARAVKLADICDNVKQCHLMPNLEKKKRFLYEKCPYFVKQGNKRFWGTEFYQEFLYRYLKQMFRLLEWEDDNKFLPNSDDNEMIYWVDDWIYYKFPNKITEKNKHEAESFDIKYAKFSDFSGKTADEIAEYCFNTNYNFWHDISESEYNSRREDLIERLKKNS